MVECIDTLNGNGPADLEELVVVQSAQMLLQSGVVGSRAEGISMCKMVRVWHLVLHFCLVQTTLRINMEHHWHPGHAG